MPQISVYSLDVLPSVTDHRKYIEFLMTPYVFFYSRPRLRSSSERQPAQAAPLLTALWSPSQLMSTSSPRVDLSTAATL